MSCFWTSVGHNYELHQKKIYKWGLLFFAYDRTMVILSSFSCVVFVLEEKYHVVQIYKTLKMNHHITIEIMKPH